MPEVRERYRIESLFSLRLLFSSPIISFAVIYCSPFRQRRSIQKVIIFLEISFFSHRAPRADRFVVRFSSIHIQL